MVCPPRRDCFFFCTQRVSNEEKARGSRPRLSEHAARVLRVFAAPESVRCAPGSYSGAHPQPPGRTHRALLVRAHATTVKSKGVKNVDLVKGCVFSTTVKRALKHTHTHTHITFSVGLSLSHFHTLSIGFFSLKNPFGSVLCNLPVFLGEKNRALKSERTLLGARWTTLFTAHPLTPVPGTY